MIKVIKRDKKWKWGRWGVIMLIIMTSTLTAYLLMTEEPPVQEVEQTRMILSEAEDLNAEVYSHKLYREAKSLYDSAMMGWKRENEKFILFRKFETVMLLAQQAEQTGRQAIVKAREVRRNFRDDLKEEIRILRQEMTEFEKVFAALPLSRVAKTKHSKGKFLLNEAEIAFEKGEYNAGREKSHEASALIRESYREARKVLVKYFEQLPEWQQELEEAIAYSKKKDTYVIVVEKMAGRCDLYYGGVKKYSFVAEFGRNWIGDKKCEGDYATPEGVYRVVRKLEGRSTIYHKALLIDYPNHKDRVEFTRLKKEGELSHTARPGNLIEIHGGGGRGANWTNGCVALENKDMDQLFRRVEKGMSITIIGASVPLEEALGYFK